MPYILVATLLIGFACVGAVLLHALHTGGGKP
jgi:hypothetical protein